MLSSILTVDRTRHQQDLFGTVNKSTSNSLQKTSNSVSRATGGKWWLESELGSSLLAYSKSMVNESS